MTNISTLADVIAWLRKWEEDRAKGLRPISEESHRAMVIDLLSHVEEGSAAKRTPCLHPAMVECSCYAAGLEEGRAAAERIGAKMDEMIGPMLKAARADERERIADLLVAALGVDREKMLAAISPK